jgi:hypothetical protein
MSVTVSEDRSMCVQPHQVVRTAWIDIDLCKLGFRQPMSPEAVKKKISAAAQSRRRRALATDRRALGRRTVSCR